jgi:integrase/recombinase XerD
MCVRPGFGCLLGLLGLRISEALHIDIEHLGTKRGHRTVTVLGKGSKLALIPLPPGVARAVDLAAADRTIGPLLLGRNGDRLNRQAATRIVVRLAKQAGVIKHTCRTPSGTASSAAALEVRIAARHADPRTTTRYERARNHLDRHASCIVTAFIAGAS